MAEPISDIIDLFTRPQFDRQMFDRLRGVLAARLIDGCLYLEIHATGASLPTPWLETITCTVVDPRNGFRAAAPVESVIRQSDGHILVKTETLRPGLDGPYALSEEAKIRLTSNCGRVAERHLCPLLRAKPQP